MKWTNLPKPIFALAPMEDVTDVVFRDIIESIAAPDVFFTEFVHASNVVLDDKKKFLNESKNIRTHGVEKAYTRRLQQSTNSTIPLVAQIWGNDPNEFEGAAQVLSQRNFAGIDINLGCPSKKIRKKNCCSGLIGKHKEITNLVNALHKGIESNKDISISIKTRLGYSDKTLSASIKEWFAFLLDLEIDALIMHARTVKDDEVPANWKAIELLSTMKAQRNSNVCLIGNGDINTHVQMKEYCTKFNLDGVMVGRGVFDTLDIFSHKSTDISINSFSFEKRLGILYNHICAYRDRWANFVDYNVLKRFYKIYLNDQNENEAHLRCMLNATTNYDEALFVVKKIM